MACHSLPWRLNNLPGGVYDVGLMTDQIGEVFLAASVKRMQLSEDDIQKC